MRQILSMKKIFNLCLLLSIAGKIFSQADTTTPNSSIKTDYLKKSKTQKTIAWTMLGVGTAMVVAGVVTAGNADYNPYPIPPTDEKFYNGATLILLGVLMDLGSIPLFIAGAKNKRRALSVSFKNELAPQLRQGSIVRTPVPSISLAIRL